VASVTGFGGLRTVALAGVAVLGVAIALAVAHRSENRSPSTVTGAGDWFTAMAAPTTHTSREKGACGVVVGPATPGVVHPVLPCGVKLYLEYEGHEVLTEVVDHGAGAAGRTFDVTPPIAHMLDLQGTQEIRWRFAG
jgi:hypothetical protein